MPLETHGRWPLVGAAAAIPVSAAATSRPQLRPLAALLWHQTEEWVWPGGFLPWVNRHVLGSDEDEFPIDRRVGFGINVLFGWGLSLGPLAGARGAAPLMTLYITHIGNIAMHLSWAARNRRYDPGTVTSVATLLPVTVAGLHQIATDPDVSPKAIRAGVGGGLLASVVLIPSLKWRLRHGRRGHAG